MPATIIKRYFNAISVIGGGVRRRYTDTTDAGRRASRHGALGGGEARGKNPVPRFSPNPDPSGHVIRFVCVYAEYALIRDGYELLSL